ncbi:MAG: alpha-L-arabinofuranosidase, partial [Tannerellaceae bacterium]|nr:alpha-L-arabinofuranosidase [Tannerellaceae bacterium]
MKKETLLLVSLFLMLSFTPTPACSALRAIYNEPDSAYLFAYATGKNRDHNGLHFAWSRDSQNWHAIGPEHSFLRSDYGAWGQEKRMLAPLLYKGNGRLWHCVWTLNEKEGVLAHAVSADLVNWNRQSYPQVVSEGNCMAIEVSEENGERYVVSWINTISGGESELFRSTTGDFKTFTPAERSPVSSRRNQRVKVSVSGALQEGTVHKLPWETIDHLIKAQQLAACKSKLYRETMKEDPVRFAGLKPVEATLTIDASESKKISDLLIGVFFEDINYAADGGLYAELIQNRGFEYDLSDKEGRDTTWDHRKAWTLKGNEATLVIDTVAPLHP